jgi:hypothetical protein
MGGRKQGIRGKFCSWKPAQGSSLANDSSPADASRQSIWALRSPNLPVPGLLNREVCEIRPLLLVLG